MNIPTDRKYSREHEWAKIDNSEVSIGITDHAQHELGDIVFVELPEVGAQYRAGEVFAVVESVKAASDVYAPVSGKILKTNEELLTAPEIINSDPYGSWFVVIEMSDQGELEQLLEAGEYSEFCKGE
ncbi:MAG: glycine cleavage system protein GcvH [Desulfotomaculaceae bacterium]|nr:glycine cleavage system protein GcvH [Desulfotomaculaceae bacterium]